MKKQTLGATIASLRRELGMTQADLAEKMSVTDKAVSKWERDLSCPDVNSLPTLAEALGVSVDALMQAKLQGDSPALREKAVALIPLVLRAVGLAMGVAVATLSILGETEVNASLTMLGVGLACLGVAQLSGDGKNGPLF